MAMPTTTTLAMPTIMFVPDLMCCIRSFQDNAALEGDLILSERRTDHPILSDKSGTVTNVWYIMKY